MANNEPQRSRAASRRGEKAKKDSQHSPLASRPADRRNSSSSSQRPVAVGTGQTHRPPAQGDERRANAAQRRMRIQGRSLRGKFMVIMAGFTFLVMVMLGGILTFTADIFLFNVTKHNAIELAKMTAALGRAVSESDGQSWPRTTRERQRVAAELITRYITDAQRWGNVNAYSWINAVEFSDDRTDPVLGGITVGEAAGGISERQGRSPLWIPGQVRLNFEEKGDIDVYALRKPIKNSDDQLPVYRVSVALNDRLGAYDPKARLRLDIATSTISNVRTTLYALVIAGVLVSLGIVLWIANRFAQQVTRPVEILLHDMQQVAGGNLEHRTKAHSTDELGVLAQEFDTMTQQLKEAQRVQIENEKRDFELSLANEVQRHLVPSQAPVLNHYVPAAYYKGAQQVSGDYFDFLPLGAGLWGFIVADVSGKGIPGSMVMAVTRTIIRLIAPRHGVSAADTLKETNRLLAKQIKRGMFVTAFYGVLDDNTHRLTFASAGHNPMVIYRAARGQCEVVQAKGIALGFNDGPVFDSQVAEYETFLQPGDTFVIYTDGFPEAMNEASEEWGEANFQATIAQYGRNPPVELIRGLLQGVVAHRGRAAQSDDLTIVAVQRTA